MNKNLKLGWEKANWILRDVGRVNIPGARKSQFESFQMGGYMFCYGTREEACISGSLLRRQWHNKSSEGDARRKGEDEQIMQRFSSN